MPRDITVTFADGTSHVYKSAPDDVTPDQVEARAAKEFGKRVAALDGGRGGAAPARPVQERTLGQSIKQGLGNVAAGAIRGAGSIGATLLYPIDKAQDIYYGDRGPKITGLVTGQQPISRNEERRRGMDEGLQTMGAEPDSFVYQAGKIAGEIAGTAGAGGALANTLGRSAVIATKAPNALQAIRTAGMSAGSAKGAANPILRAAGGAVTGGVSAGMVEPNQAGLGAVVGGVLPGAIKVAGVSGNAIGRLLRGPEQAADVAQAVRAARAAGYVIPPTQAKPTLGNRLLEGFSGKITTAQNASAKNQAVTNAKASSALGLPTDTKITPDVLKSIRDQAGQAYEAIGSTGAVQPGKAYVDALDKIAAPFVKTAQSFPNAKPSPVLELVDSLKSPAFDAAAAVEKIKQLRSAADDAFRSGSPGATDLARASRSAATAIEDALESHLTAVGAPELLQKFRDGRQLIAKTYSVEKALNPATGSIDARKLAAQLQKGKPLSGELKEAAEFAGRFPKASQTVEQMGSLPQTSPLDWAAAGTISAATSNPLMLASAMARPGARALALSPVVQNRLVQSRGNSLSRLADPAYAQLFYRAAPVTLAGQ